MPATETRLPLGNEWEFSKRNINPGVAEVQPAPQITEILQPIGPLQQIVQEVQFRFIREGWQFTSLVTDLRFVETDRMFDLAVVFTHPLRTALVPRVKGMDLEFIKPGVSVGVEDLPPSDPINQILEGTNWFAQETSAGYNIVLVKEELFKQTGVGIFAITLDRVERRISDLDKNREELMRRLGSLQSIRAAWVALQSPNPVPLFQTK